MRAGQQHKFDVVTPQTSASALNMSSRQAAALLSRWHQKGWLKRVRRGFYVPVPLTSAPEDTGLENARVAAMNLFKPCYIGGWSAIEYWSLTDQIFTTTLVVTFTKPRHNELAVHGTNFKLKHAARAWRFGLHAVWHNETKVYISNPHKTMADVLCSPEIGGSIHLVSQAFYEYATSNFVKNVVIKKYRCLTLTSLSTILSAKSCESIGIIC